MRYACENLVLPATDQAKAVRELTQHVRETTSEVAELDVGETTRKRNDRKPLGRYSILKSNLIPVRELYNTENASAKNVNATKKSVEFPFLYFKAQTKVVSRLLGVLLLCSCIVGLSNGSKRL